MILKRTGVIQTASVSPETFDAGSDSVSKSGLAWATLRPGTLLQERYEILGVLGHGGMSTVYRARDRRFTSVERIVAVKEMFTVAQDAAALRQRLATFEREANLLATLQHPSIPKIYDYFTLDGRIYLILEFVDGRNLESVLDERGSPIPEPEVVNWAVQICELLSYLHNQKPNPIVFRDMKPSNIMLRTDGRQIVLVDFGIARTFQADERGTMIGTEGYAPPEQYRGQAGPAGDIYALGATLHHLSTANDPRLETPFTFHQRPPRQLNPALSEAFEAIVLKAVAYNAAHRFASAEEMRQALLASQLTATPPVSAPTQSIRARPKKPAVVRKTTKPVTGPGAGSKAMPAEGAAERIRWTVRTGDEVRSSPVVVGDHVYVGSYDGNLYAVAIADGSVAWRAGGARGICSTPAVTDELVVYGSEDHSIYAVQRATGRRVWAYRSGLPVRSSPRIAGDRVFIGSDDSYLYCLDLRKGSLIWRARTWSHIRSSCGFTGTLVTVGSDDGYLYAIDHETGGVVWRFQTGGPVIASPCVVDDVIFFGSTDGTIYTVRAASGERVWRLATGQPVVASVTVQDDIAYAASVSGSVYALAIDSGEVYWQHDDPAQVTSTPAVDDAHVYYGSADGHIRCLNRDDGELVWQVKTGGAIPSSPAVADGSLYIGSIDHCLYAVSTEAAPPPILDGDE